MTEATSVSITTVTSREFNQDAGRAKRAAADGPVFITDRGEPRHVLLSIEQYRRLTGNARSLVDALAAPTHEDLDFEPPRVQLGTRVADLD